MFRIRLKSLRESRGMTQRDFATDFGVSKGTIGMWESGAREPKTLDELNRIADYFGVSVDYLLGRDENSQVDESVGWYPPMRFWDKINSDRARFMHYFIWGNPDCIAEIENKWHISVDHPELASDENFKRFIEANVRLVSFLPEDGEWGIQLKKTPTPVPEDGLSNMECLLMQYVHDLTQDQQEMLLAQMQVMKKAQKEAPLPFVRE